MPCAGHGLTVAPFRVAAVLLVSALGLVAMVAAGQSGGFGPGKPLEIRHVGVAGGEPYTAQLSGGVIAFEGPWRGVLAAPIMVHDVRTRSTEDTGVVGRLACFDYPYLVIGQNEQWQGDLNGDGDNMDSLAVVYDVVSREAHTFAEGVQYGSRCASPGHIGYERIEPYDRIDYNHDGDVLDTVALLYDIEHGTESMLGTTGAPPFLAGRYAVWACSISPPWTDLCIRDVVSGGERRAGFPGWGFPPYTATDGAVFAFTTGFGADERLGYAILSTGALVMLGSLGSAFGGSLPLSEGRILGAYGYGNAKLGHFLYDTATLATLDLPDLPAYNLQFYGDTILRNNSSGACICPPGEPLPWPSAVIGYDLVTRERWDIGLNGFLGESIVGFDGETVIVTSDERVAGEDVNRDGDLNDRLVMYATRDPLPPGESSVGWAPAPEGLSIAFVFVVLLLALAEVPRFSQWWSRNPRGTRGEPGSGTGRLPSNPARDGEGPGGRSRSSRSRRPPR